MELADRSIPLLADASVSETAVALRAEAQLASGERFFTLPFNHYDPDNSAWWILPSSERPAFRLGKIIVTRDWEVGAPVERLVGLHVEKGVEGERAGEVYRRLGGGALVMTDRWRWHGFRDAMASGRVAEQAAVAESAAGRPLTVAVVAGLQRAPTPSARSTGRRTSRPTLRDSPAARAG